MNFSISACRLAFHRIADSTRRTNIRKIIRFIAAVCATF